MAIVTRVLPPQLPLDPLVTRSFYAASLAEPRQASGLMRTLARALPLPLDARHLKRIRKGAAAAAAVTASADNTAAATAAGAPPTKRARRGAALTVLLCAAEDAAAVATLDALLEPDAALAPFALRRCTVDVPRHAPRSAAVFRAMGAIWPVIFHASTREAQLQLAIGAVETAQMAAHMRLALGAATAAAARGDRAVGAVIVDPSQTPPRVVATAGDATRAHPLGFAALRCVEQVAAQLCALRTAAEHAAPPTRLAATDGVGAPRYLCTGLDVYVTEDPDVLCAMALLHSRVRRVVFARPNCTSGGLGGSGKNWVHTHPSLNHHFEAWRLDGVEEEEEEEVEGGAGTSRSGPS